MSSSINSENIQLLINPTAFTGGNLFFIQLADNSTTLPSLQTNIHQVSNNVGGRIENLQCLVPILPSNLPEGAPNLTPQLIIHKDTETNVGGRIENLQCLVPILPSNLTDGAPNLQPQLIIHKDTETNVGGRIENLQCLVPIVPSNLTEAPGNLLPQLILAKLENVPLTTSKEQNQIYIVPQNQNIQGIPKKDNISSNKNSNNQQHPVATGKNDTSKTNNIETQNQKVNEKTEATGPKINSNIVIEPTDKIIKATPSAYRINKKQIHDPPQHQNVKDSVQSKGTSKKPNTKVTKTKQQSCPNRTIPLPITNYVQIPDRPVPPRAVATLPLCLRQQRDCNAIYSIHGLMARVRFGPVQGNNHTINPSEADRLVAAASASHTPVFLMRKGPDSVIHVDVTDKDKSNWMGLLPLGTDSTANVWLYEEAGELYGITTKAVLPRVPLLLGYSNVYFEEHKLPVGSPVSEVQEDTKTSGRPNSWRCMECDSELESLTLLQKHIYKHRTCAMPTKPKRPKCRCLQCKRMFSGKFALRRHLTRATCVMPPRTDNESSPESRTKSTKRIAKVARNRTEQCPTPIEETRLLDESLQNYTNGLDISTNLFDPDRMPNLDTSGSDFNPFSLLSSGLKEENLANDAEYAKFTHGLMNKSNDIISKNKPKFEEKVVCPYCRQSVIKSKNRHHFRNCDARKVKCECGQTFYKKKSLARHIQEEHSDNVTNKPKIKIKIEKPEEDSSNDRYKCEECHWVFKRRGMLVNHMWRVHKRPMPLLPLQRSVRVYPCTVCSIVYRSAAKRKLHTLREHPGASLEGALSISIGRAACSVAACPACPRQYATRAKLYQHQREKHPLLAPPKIQELAAKKREKCGTVKQVEEQSSNPTSQLDSTQT